MTFRAILVHELERYHKKTLINIILILLACNTFDFYRHRFPDIQQIDDAMGGTKPTQRSYRRKIMHLHDIFVAFLEALPEEE